MDLVPLVYFTCFSGLYTLNLKPGLTFQTLNQQLSLLALSFEANLSVKYNIIHCVLFLFRKM